jgi:radical SAM protein with 4Fe4S-binding SPASM domain
MIINQKIMLRIEEGFGLLYDGNNGNTVTIPCADALALQNGNVKYFVNSNRQAVLLKLRNDGFVSLSKEIDIGTSVLNPDDIQKANVLTLKSERSPYKILWAVTLKCNMKCLYCWPDVVAVRQEYSGLGINDLKKIANQLVKGQVCKVIITGGEALLCKEVWDVISVLRAGGCTVMLISNGTTICKEILEKVKANDVALGISFDAPTDEINSITRRINIVDKVSDSIRFIIAENIQMAALVTVTKHNFDYIERHVAYLDSLGVKVIVLQDLKPFGTPEIYNDTRLTVEQEKRISGLMNDLKKNYSHIRFDSTELMYFCNRKPNEKGTIMTCDAGENGGYIDFHGNFMPCSFLSNLTYGNVLEKNLKDLWQISEAAQKLKELRKIKVGELEYCKGCSEINDCDGGCRADALLENGDFFGLASRCPKKMGILNDIATKNV